MTKIHPHYYTDLSTMAKTYGLPLYIYDTQVIKEQIAQLNTYFSGVPLEIKYAMKALNNINIVKLMKQWGIGIDCVSINEVKIAIKAGHKPENVFYTPSCVAFSEIEQAVEAGVQINIGDFPLLEQFAQKYGGKTPCCIRIRPDVMAGGHKKISTGHAGSKFGISIHQLDDVHALVKEYGLVIEGLHKHTGSDITDVDLFIKAADVLFEVAKTIPTIKYLDFGSGFKITYKEGDLATDMSDLGAKLTKRFNDFCTEVGRPLKFMIEPGKYLVSASGFLLVEVNMVKSSHEMDIVGVNSGLNHLIRPMMYDAFHDIENISNPNGKVKDYKVVGYICETDDFAANIALAEVRQGDILAIKNGGAYAMSMASNYNSRVRPAEVLIYKGDDYLIRERETFEDLLNKQIEHNFDED